MAYAFNFLGQEKEPTDEEVLAGFVHYVGSYLLMLGSPNYLVKHFRDLERRKITKQDVYEVMNAVTSMAEKYKGRLSQLPRITIKKAE